MLLYHRCDKLEDVVYGDIAGSKEFFNPELHDKEFEEYYSWLSKLVGFHPLFASVGNDIEDIRLTGYQYQWQVVTSYTYDKKGRKKTIEKRKKGEFPNYVLFSFDKLEGEFISSREWGHVICVRACEDYIKEFRKLLLLQPDWNRELWEERAIDEPGDVQLLAKKIDYRKAKRVWVRNKSTKKKLEEVGFAGVEVHRVDVGDW